MPCKKCGSLNEREFSSETNIHFSGQEGRENLLHGSSRIFSCVWIVAAQSSQF